MILAMILWAVLLTAVAAVYINKLKGKKKYKDADFSSDPAWLEKSLAKYPEDITTRRYYFHYDTEFINAGHILEDENHKVVYEAKVLYNNGLQADETDFVNHIINYTHHHKLGKGVSSGLDDSIAFDSTLKFDGKDVFEYLKELGYDYTFSHKGTACTYEILKNGTKAGTLYTSNKGKNLYERDTKEVVAKTGDRGNFVIECKYSDLDILFLYAVVFTRIDISLDTLTHKA